MATNAKIKGTIRKMSVGRKNNGNRQKMAASSRHHPGKDRTEATGWQQVYDTQHPARALPSVYPTIFFLETDQHE